MGKVVGCVVGRRGGAGAVGGCVVVGWGRRRVGVGWRLPLGVASFRARVVPAWSWWVLAWWAVVRPGGWQGVKAALRVQSACRGGAVVANTVDDVVVLVVSSIRRVGRRRRRRELGIGVGCLSVASACHARRGRQGKVGRAGRWRCRRSCRA